MNTVFKFRVRVYVTHPDGAITLRSEIINRIANILEEANCGQPEDFDIIGFEEDTTRLIKTKQE